MVRSRRYRILLAPLLVLAGCGGPTSSGPTMPDTNGPVEASPASEQDSVAVDPHTKSTKTALPSEGSVAADASDAPTFREDVVLAMRKAATFYREQVASHGGYVYYYSPDLGRRWGEGEATKDQIWVQPPGTPTVGMAYLKAYAATGDKYYLEAATESAEALRYGQLESGGWTNCIDFDPRGRRSAQYRNGKGKGKNYSSLDDGQTQSAVELLIKVDAAHDFKHDEIHEATQIALDALLKAQFPNGAFPQVWKGPVTPQPVVAASYPEYDWKTEGRIKEYWNMYTLNDNVPGYVARALIEAYRVYNDEKYLTALKRLGDFLRLAQMPDPQPAWAQQYNYEMNPIWARKFEPPAISGGESQDVIDTLLLIYRETGEREYLEPIPRALAYLKGSLLPDGRLARYYELETNKPLYMSRRGDVYKLTYDDSNLPSHYGWKVDSRLDELQRQYHELSRGGGRSTQPRPEADLENEVRQIIDQIDDRGRWVSTYQGERLVGQPKFPLDSQYISSDVFSRNMTTLSEYLANTPNVNPRRDSNE